MVKGISVTLPEELHAAVKIWCVSNRMKMKEVVPLALAKLIKYRSNGSGVPLPKPKKGVK